MEHFSIGDPAITLFHANALKLYPHWESPTIIISDGPYGVSGFPGDFPTPDNLKDWYEPHIKAWSEYSTPQTTLWFWCTEIGWAMVHPLLDQSGWEYRGCHIWDKGMAHVAGNTNSQSLRKLPIVTEVCVQYTKRATFCVDGQNLSMKDWLRQEWLRTGLPLSKTNEACGVKNAATRKYFTKDHLWYYPPPDAFEKIVEYANTFGEAAGKPYFSIDGIHPLSKIEWEKYRTKFYCPIGVTNVWHEPPVNGSERIKIGGRALHANQKPLALMELIISISSDVGDMIWEPFGGLCTGAVAAHNLKRACLSAEISIQTYQSAVERLSQHLQKARQPSLF
jgi:DNA modification methylase